MAQHYSNPKRENDPHALPDLEVWWESGRHDTSGERQEPGFYWWSCLPGCLPDSDPSGPFETEAEALADAREGMDE